MLGHLDNLHPVGVSFFFFYVCQEIESKSHLCFSRSLSKFIYFQAVYFGIACSIFKFKYSALRMFSSLRNWNETISSNVEFANRLDWDQSERFRQQFRLNVICLNIAFPDWDYEERFKRRFAQI